MTEKKRPLLKKFRIENFTSIEKAEVVLSPLTVFIGPNNSGKTNFFRALDWFSQLVSENRSSPFAIKRDNEGYSRYFHNFTSKKICLTCEYEGINHDRGLGLEIEEKETKIALLEEDGSFITGADLLKGDATREIREYFHQLRYFSLLPKIISASNNVFVDPEISFEGGNVTAVLDFLKGEHPDTFDKIERELKQCVPEVERIILKNFATNVKQIGIKEKSCDKPFIGSEISEGILLFITLLAIIHQPNPAKIICLEEPEQHIHPRRLRSILDYLTDLAYHVAEPVQILISTHSPYFLNYFKDRPEEVVIVDKKEGKTTFTSLLEHEYLFQDQKEELSLGELWFSGLVGGVPKP